MNSETKQTQTKLIALADSYQKALFDYYPEKALWLGRTDVAQDRFRDNTLHALKEWEHYEDRTLDALKQLNEADLIGSSAHNTYQLLKETLESNQGIRICHEDLWNINPLWGWHIITSVIAEKQPVGTPLLREQALKRWQSFDRLVAEEINNLKVGLSQEYIAPKPAVVRTLQQVKMLVNTPIENSPFFDFAKRDGTPEFKKQIAQLIEEKINPALIHYAQYLENEYLPQAREQVGVSALPHGEACYLAKIKKETTLNLSAKEIHEFGLAHMQQIQREVGVIGQRAFGKQEMVDIFHQAKHSPHYLFHSEAEIISYNQAALARVNAILDSWFKVIPKSQAAIKPFPAHRAQTGAPGEYHPPSDDGKRPGLFYINTFEPQKRSRVDQEATLFHELIPGHHYQIAISYEDTSHHSLDKYLWNAGFGEGWALYAERLADEMGLYQDDVSRIGMLSNEALRTARLVVDPGMHVMGWTREQAVNYLKHHTALDDNLIESEVDRYIMLPGQATAYMVGKREITNLRQMAQSKLGTDFDIREFHYQVLKNGAVTLPMLRGQVQSWLEEEQA